MSHTDSDSSIPFENIFIPTSDGLRLRVRKYASAHPDATSIPVVCLHGLARSSADFAPLAQHIASTTPHTVYALDSRGRGESSYDPKWPNYTLLVELADLIAALSALNISKAVFVGTSRGGLLIHLLASLHLEKIAAVVLNDIGPVLEVEGSKRIQSYIGQLPTPTSEAACIRIMRDTFGAFFPSLTDQEWGFYAKTTWKTLKVEGNTQYVLDYDPNLMLPLKSFDFSKPMPPLWEAFMALSKIPVLAIRGEFSDLLSEATLKDMGARHPNLETYTAQGQGHAPLLIRADLMQRITDFIKRTTF
jgi:pimeloyl-ACP methyl ester carboxylesterase